MSHNLFLHFIFLQCPCLALSEAGGRRGGRDLRVDWMSALRRRLGHVDAR